MSRYELRPAGVFDGDSGRLVLRTDPAWLDYEAWLRAGNVPDPMPAPPAPTIEQRRAERSALVNILREQKVAGGVTFDGKRFATDPLSRANLSGAVASANGPGGVPPGLVWRSEDNQAVPMTPQKLAQFGRAVLDHVNACYACSWQLKDAIASSNDPESVDITAGWPS